MRQLFARQLQQFDSLFNRKAFLTEFQRENMFENGLEPLSEARAVVKELIEEYRAAEKVSYVVRQGAFSRGCEGLLRVEYTCRTTAHPPRSTRTRGSVRNAVLSLVSPASNPYRALLCPLRALYGSRQRSHTLSRACGDERSREIVVERGE